MKRSLYLIQGVSGSGKSTLARKLIEHGVARLHYEADMFFCKDGEYQFDGTKLVEAHRWCQKSVDKGISEYHSVVVSNTFTKIEDMEYYLQTACYYQLELVVFRLAGRRYESIHNVPNHVIERQIKQLREFDPDSIRESLVKICGKVFLYPEFKYVELN